MSDNTIFDDVFRTMVEKMPYLLIPLINEVFHTSYPEDVDIIPLRNEHQGDNGELITDSRLLLGGKVYHIECQSTDDTTMAIRMVEYDFAIALENVEKDGRFYRMEFPRSCVLYLRSSEQTPDFLEVNLMFADETTHLYRIPTIKMSDYTSDNIFEKNLLLLLPFYIMRYEKQSKELRENPELFQNLLGEYETIRLRLEKELTETGKAELYTNLIKLITKIADYIFRKEKKLQKGLGDVMGGQVLELESERLRREGKAEGIVQGKAEGLDTMSILINHLIRDKRSDEIQAAVTDKTRLSQLLKEYGL